MYICPRQDIFLKSNRPMFQRRRMSRASHEQLQPSYSTFYLQSIIWSTILFNEVSFVNKNDFAHPELLPARTSLSLSPIIYDCARSMLNSFAAVMNSPGAGLRQLQTFLYSGRSPLNPLSGW